MSKIEYKSGSLFEAPEGSFLAHAVNCRGVWGSGIAKEFKEKFPRSFGEYNLFCRINDQTKGNPLGYSLITEENICCLFTSNNYGILVDKPHQILTNTTLSLDDLALTLNARHIMNEIKTPVTVCSNKFNSGLFNVPWEQTEYAINRMLQRQNIIEKWVVYSQD